MKIALGFSMNTCHRTLLIIASILSLDAFSQSHETIRTGRPGQAIGANVVGTRYLQLQSGIDLLASHAEPRESTTLNNVLRYGINEKFELSAVMNYQKDNYKNAEDTDGVSETQLGFRYNIIEKSKGLTPALGIQTRFRTRFTNKQFKNDHLAPIIIIATNHKLNQRFALTNNFGTVYDGNTAIPNYTMTTNLSFSLTDKVGSYIEIFGNLKDGYGKIFFGTGISYLLNNDLQFDGSISSGRNREVTETIASVGLSWRRKIFE